MFNASLQYPVFGPDIHCPHCRQLIPALTLTDTYLCPRHGAFEADPKTGELVHLQSGRHWRLWNGEWYRQHTHPDGIRFEIHEALDRLYTQGFKATKVIIANRYRDLVSSYIERNTNWRGNGLGAATHPRPYVLPIALSSDAHVPPAWDAIHYYLERQPGVHNSSL